MLPRLRSSAESARGEMERFERHLRAEMFENVVFVVGSGEIMRLPLRGTTIAKVRRTVERDYPSARILNDLTMAEAIRLVP